MRGHCWKIPTSADDFPETDNVADPRRSCLILSEDGRDLGPAHWAIDMVAQEGRGQYSHWENVLYLSATDNSDPTTNGRAYTIRRDQSVYFAQTAAYALIILENWAGRLPGGIDDVRGKTVLEVGPGRSMGTVAAMAALGCTVLAVDRFCGDWQAGWHEPFLEALKAGMTSRDWAFDAGIIDCIVANRSFSCENIIVETRPTEHLFGRYKDFAQLSFSHSTFEHFYSVEEAAAVMAETSAPGSQGIHDVDFRDHANFGTPLEFLLYSDEAYADDAVNNFYGRGNRIRPAQMKDDFLRAGFGSVQFEPYAEADTAYLDSLSERLGQTTESRFRNFSRDELSLLAGTFILRR